MSRSIFMDEDRPRRRPALTRGARVGWFVIAAIVVCIVGGWWVYTQFRIDVDTGMLAVLTQKTGKDISNSDEVAPDESYRGVQRKVLTEGRYFYNPYKWDWKYYPQIVIPKDKIGVKISLTGADLPYGEFLARTDKKGKLTKGVVEEVLRSGGRFPINPYLFEVEEYDPITIPAGFKGVVTNLAGPMPKEPNTLLVEKGFRGVQKETLDPGTYVEFSNPYISRISLVDCRSQRFNLAEKKDMGFPSKDGFWVSLDGRIEFRVNPDMAAEVFVTYNEVANGESIDEEIIRKIILPNARSFCRLEGSNKLGREMIEGATRSEFQDVFQKRMIDACQPLGIEIVQALITSITPPEQIALPVRDRELAKQEGFKFTQQITQQEQERILAEKAEQVVQKSALIDIEKEIARVTKEAEREQEVDVIKANEGLAVAQFKLDAAKDEAAAILARGKADADVIRFENEADAAGWKAAVEAFNGNGNQYAQYVMFQKMSSAYRRIMVNTADSPIMKVFEAFANPISSSSANTPAGLSSPKPTESKPATKTKTEKRAAVTASKPE